MLPADTWFERVSSSADEFISAGHVNRRRDRGHTLVEVVITVVLLGTTVVAIMNAVHGSGQGVVSQPAVNAWEVQPG